MASATSRSVIGADGWSFNPSPTPGVSTPLRRRIDGLWIAPALITTRSAVRLAALVRLHPDRPAIVEHDPVDVDVTHDLEVRPGADRVEVGLDHRDPSPVTTSERHRSGVGVGGDERSIDGAPLVLRYQLGVDQVIGEERTAGQRDHGVHGARATHPSARHVSRRRLPVDADRCEIEVGPFGVGEIVEETPPVAGPALRLAPTSRHRRFGAPVPIPATSPRSTDRRSDGRRAHTRQNLRRRSSIVWMLRSSVPCHDDDASSPARWASSL